MAMPALKVSSLLMAISIQTATTYFLGAIMVRGITVTDAFGNFTLLYSKDAAEWGLQAGNPWRVIGWADTALQN